MTDECPHCGWTPAEQDTLSEEAAAHDCVEVTLRDLIDIASRQDAALIALRRHLADLEFASGVKSSEIERLRAALEKAADTFADIARTSRLLHHDVMASAAMVAEEATRAVLR